MPPPLLLLPPSEGKATGGTRRRTPDRFAPLLGTERTAVLDALAKATASASDAELSRLLRVRGPLLEQATAATRCLIEGTAPTLPAWRRYCGVVWDYLDPVTLTAAERARILIPSALYGLTTAEDQIAEYRLGMAIGLPEIGSLARFWRRSLTELVRSKRRGAVIIDLLPTEHRSAFDWGRLGPVVEVSFVAANGHGAAGHVAKAVKGRFARHLIDHGVEGALGFTFDRWTVRCSDRGFALHAPR
jgi:hypothetical protein